MDFTRMLGPTVDGEWQTEEGVRGQEEEQEEVGLELLISSANVSKAVNKWLASCYWAIQRSWFAQVNALCNLSRKKSREVAAHFRANF